MQATDKMAFIAFATIAVAGVIIAVRAYQIGDNTPTKEEILKAIENGSATTIVPTSTDN